MPTQNYRRGFVAVKDKRSTSDLRSTARNLYSQGVGLLSIAVRLDRDWRLIREWLDLPSSKEFGGYEDHNTRAGYDWT